jgi:hypothetical protein
LLNRAKRPSRGGKTIPSRKKEGSVMNMDPWSDGWDFEMLQLFPTSVDSGDLGLFRN